MLFKRLKERFICTPIIHYFNKILLIYIETDTLIFTILGILS
jgi:hypothetical protein